MFINYAVFLAVHNIATWTTRQQERLSLQAAS